MTLFATVLAIGALNLAEADSVAMSVVLNDAWCAEDAVVGRVVENPHDARGNVTVVEYLHPGREARIYMTDSMAVAVGATVADAETDIYITDRAGETVPYTLRFAVTEPDVSVGPEGLIEISFTESASMTVWPDTLSATVYDLRMVYRRYVVGEDGSIVLGEMRPVIVQIADLMNDYKVSDIELATYLAGLRPALRPQVWRSSTDL